MHSVLRSVHLTCRVFENNTICSILDSRSCTALQNPPSYFEQQSSASEKQPHHDHTSNDPSLWHQQPASTTSNPSTVRFPLPLSFQSRSPYTPTDTPILPTEKGQPFPLTPLQNKVVLIVNTASKCGFTPQFENLETLYKKLKASHPNEFEIIGVPCNQFMNQDPGDNDTIQDFCVRNYGVSFPILGKTDVNGEKAEPVFEWLKAQAPGLLGMKRVKWNFEKFLVGRDGVCSYSIPFRNGRGVSVWIW